MRQSATLFISKNGSARPAAFSNSQIQKLRLTSGPKVLSERIKVHVKVHTYIPMNDTNVCVFVS